MIDGDKLPAYEVSATKLSAKLMEFIGKAENTEEKNRHLYTLHALNNTLSQMYSFLRLQTEELKSLQATTVKEVEPLDVHRLTHAVKDVLTPEAPSWEPPSEEVAQVIDTILKLGWKPPKVDE